MVALELGLQHRRLSGDVGPGSGIVIVLVLVYVVWLPAVLVGWVWVQDHLGLHYTYTERPGARPGARGGGYGPA